MPTTLGDPRLITTWTALRSRGVSPDRIRAQLDAERWRRWGHAIALHNGPLRPACGLLAAAVQQRLVSAAALLHLDQRRWWDDRYRQNEIALSDAIVLRFPSVVARAQPELVAAQIRRAPAL